MKKLFCFLVFTTFLSSLAFAGPWGIVVNMNSMNIQTIDLGQTPPKVYGPFLTGSLGTSGQGLWDVAITPDSNYALVSNFYGHKIYRIDISNPTIPTFAGSLDVGSFYPEDIAISPNGRFAVISDGGSLQLAFIDLSIFSNYSLYTLTTSNGYANAVEIGNDNSTIILCDYSHNQIIYGRVNAALSGLISESTLTSESYPINVTISPDGATVLVACVSRRISVFQITGPGLVASGSTASIALLDYPQSIAFSPDGKKAYVVCEGTGPGNPNTFSWFQVNGPGNVTLGGDRAANLISYAYTGMWYGVDTLAVSPSGDYAIANKPGLGSDIRNRVSRINLSNYQATAIDTTQIDAAGVATFNESMFPPYNASLSRLTNNFIFYKEYINRLTWQANAKNKYPISTYVIYRKAASASDTTYTKVGEVGSSTFSYDDRGLKKTDEFAYRITSIDSRGVESAPAEVSNVIVMRRVR
jgi:DNA-binding beta-propeller fold protein YncE